MLTLSNTYGNFAVEINPIPFNRYVMIQGKRAVNTYFLLGKEGFNKPMPDLSMAAPLSAHLFK